MTTKTKQISNKYSEELNKYWNAIKLNYIRLSLRHASIWEQNCCKMPDLYRLQHEGSRILSYIQVIQCNQSWWTWVEIRSGDVAEKRIQKTINQKGNVAFSVRNSTKCVIILFGHYKQTHNKIAFILLLWK